MSAWGVGLHLCPCSRRRRDVPESDRQVPDVGRLPAHRSGRRTHLDEAGRHEVLLRRSIGGRSKVRLGGAGSRDGGGLMAKTKKTAGSARNAAGPGLLRWDVFVTPGLPIVTRDKPPGIRETFFQATASTLIYGARDAVLVDAFMTVAQANALADWVATHRKNLTTIYITHGHGDHWFGIGTLLERFPNARAVATPNVVKVMRQHASPERLKRWKASFPHQIPDRLVIAEELKGNVIHLEGHELVAVELGHTDTDYTTCLNVPSVGLVVAGDAAYNDVHLYLA